MEKETNCHIKDTLIASIIKLTSINVAVPAVDEMKKRFSGKIICTYCIFSDRVEFFKYDDINSAPIEGYIKIGKRNLDIIDLKKITSKIEEESFCYIERHHDDNSWIYVFVPFKELINSLY